MAREARFLAGGDTALVVEFGDRIDARLSALVLGLYKRLEAAQEPGVVELVPTMRSLMVHYDPLLTSRAHLEIRIGDLLQGLEGAEIKGRRWSLPVCYEGEDFAPDLAEVARRTATTPEEVVALHTRGWNLVYMVGFLPGLPYIGGLDPKLELPRRENPRTRVPAGSVSIATTMTCIYPLESPGGWHLIGRTPVPLFDLTRDPAVLLAPADEVRFVPVPRTEYERLAAEAKAGKLVLEPEEGP